MPIRNSPAPLGSIATIAGSPKTGLRGSRLSLLMTCFCFLFTRGGVIAQLNLQHHYDMGRGIFTSTAEFLFHDSLGTTFGFADINYDSYHYQKKGATDVYYEVARYFTIPWLNGNLNATIQYNDGVIFLPAPNSTLFSAVNPIWLGGFSYFFLFETGTLSADFLARYESGDEGHTYQLTLVWYYPFSRKFACAGFFDLWNSKKDGVIVFMTEPQVLYSLGKWEAGVEVEVSRNFPGAWTRKEEYKEDKLWLIPTIFVKYTF